MKMCSVDGCDGQFLARGMCRKHYLEWDRRENPEKWRRYQETYDERHPGRRLVQARARYAKNPAKHKEYVRRSLVKKQYGLTFEEYTAILARGCAICGSDGPRMALDHCHTTGKVRDALCTNCNNGLGRFADDPARLRSAANYLEKHRSTKRRHGMETQEPKEGQEAQEGQEAPDTNIERVEGDVTVENGSDDQDESKDE